MKTTKNSIVAVSLALGLANLSGLGAQSTTESTIPVAAPATEVTSPASETSATSAPTAASVTTLSVATPESVTIKPSITTGVRTMSEGKLAGGAGGSTVGPFVRPSAALSFKNSKVSATLSYDLEVTGGEGVGANKKSAMENAYFQHEPIIVISGGLLPNWKINGVLDMIWKYANEDRTASKTDMFVNPEIQYNLTPGISLAAGYVLHRVENFEDSPLHEAGSAARAATVKSKTAVVGADGERPTSTLQAGVLTNKIELGAGTKLTTYVRAGKRANNQAGKTSYSYRFQTHLDFASPIAELTGALRYRFNVEDYKNRDIYDYYNLGLVELNYALTSNWSLNVKNEFTVLQSNLAGNKAAFENENYVGATFAF